MADALSITFDELNAALAAGKFVPAAAIAYEAYGLDFASAVADIIREGHPPELLLDADAPEASDHVRLMLIDNTGSAIALLTLAVHIPAGAHPALGTPGFFIYQATAIGDVRSWAVYQGEG